MQARRQNIQAAIMGQYKIFGRIHTWPSWAYTKHLFSSFPACPGPLQLHWQQQMSILWAHSCILSMTLQVNSGPIRAHRQIPPSVLGPYMGLMQFPYMCLVGPYEAHMGYVFIGPYIYMHLSYTMGPRQLYQGVCEIVTWALPSTMTQICIMGSPGTNPGITGCSDVPILHDCLLLELPLEIAQIKWVPP